MPGMGASTASPMTMPMDASMDMPMGYMYNSTFAQYSAAASLVLLFLGIATYSAQLLHTR